MKIWRYEAGTFLHVWKLIVFLLYIRETNLYKM
jgi:hypothetical protein